MPVRNTIHGGGNRDQRNYKSEDLTTITSVHLFTDKALLQLDSMVLLLFNHLHDALRTIRYYFTIPR